MDLFIVNRYVPNQNGEIETNDEEILRKNLLSKIEERKRKSLSGKDDSEPDPKITNTTDVDQEEIKVKKRKKKKKKVEEVPQENIEEPPKAFQVLGKDTFAHREKIKRVLPHWLKNPSVVSVDLRNLTHTVDSIAQLDRSLVEKLKTNGVSHFFPVQTQVIPWLLDGISRPSVYWPNDICVSAPTGSGKTLAFVLPIIQALQNRLTTQIRALVVLPVQDLAKQVFRVFTAYSAHTNLNVLLLSNVVNFVEEQRSLVKKDKLNGYRALVDILVTTPGRLVDHLQKTEGLSLQELKYLVIDEADRVMEGVQNDWLYHVNIHLGLHSGTSKSFQVPPLCLRSLQTEKRPPQKLLFSATLSQDPEKLQQLGLFQPKLFTSVVNHENGNLTNGEKSTADEFVGKITTPAELSEAFVLCTPSSKPVVLFHLVQLRSWKNVLIFTKSCETAHRLAILMKRLGQGKLKVAEMTSKTGSVRRIKRLEKFAKGVLHIMVSSDALARGIDIPNVDCVISYDAPRYIKNHVHRIGRTGRAGNKGTAVTLLEHSQANHFKQMMAAAGKTSIEEIVVKDEDLETHAELYKASLENIKKVLEIQNNISSSLLKKRKGLTITSKKKLKEGKDTIKGKQQKSLSFLKRSKVK